MATSEYKYYRDNDGRSCRRRRIGDEYDGDVFIDVARTCEDCSETFWTPDYEVARRPSVCPECLKRRWEADGPRREAANRALEFRMKLFDFLERIGEQFLKIHLWILAVLIPWAVLYSISRISNRSIMGLSLDVHIWVFPMFVCTRWVGGFVWAAAARLADLRLELDRQFDGNFRYRMIGAVVGWFVCAGLAGLGVFIYYLATNR